MMDNKYRIRLRGKSIGQIDRNLLEMYGELYPYENATVMFSGMIEKEILHRDIESHRDLDQAEELVKNLYYRNIGEFLEDHMRRTLMDDFRICRNCMRCEGEKRCPIDKRRFHKWNAACEKYLKRRSI